MEGNFTKSIVFGLMSGTSCDGLDIAACRFGADEMEGDCFELLAGHTFEFPEDLRKQLLHASTLGGRDLHVLDIRFVHFMAECVKQFKRETGIIPDLIASHGHTVFHQPALGYTVQIGSGAALASACKVDTVSDFRQTDVSLGGQGAPLVPLGDYNLFREWDYCVNIGGFANITLNRSKPLKAYDICAANLVLNTLAGKEGMSYDRDGLLASSGTKNEALFDALNALTYYNIHPPKSLGTEWLEKELFPVLAEYPISSGDLLCTYVEHVAYQIARACPSKSGRMMLSGGGAFNRYLVERIKALTPILVMVPDSKMVNFKEALIFAYLGWLRSQGRINVYSSVTGASMDSVAGAYYKGF